MISILQITSYNQTNSDHFLNEITVHIHVDPNTMHIKVNKINNISNKIKIFYRTLLKVERNTMNERKNKK